jgi:hypothetical protein
MTNVQTVDISKGSEILGVILQRLDLQRAQFRSWILGDRNRLCGLPGQHRVTEQDLNDPATFSTLCEISLQSLEAANSNMSLEGMKKLSSNVFTAAKKQGNQLPAPSGISVASHSTCTLFQIDYIDMLALLELRELDAEELHSNSSSSPKLEEILAILELGAAGLGSVKMLAMVLELVSSAPDSFYDFMTSLQSSMSNLRKGLSEETRREDILNLVKPKISELTRKKAQTINYLVERTRPADVGKDVYWKILDKAQMECPELNILPKKRRKSKPV